MRYLALATDYDGTLAHDGQVDQQTVAALRRLAASDRRLILVTGRQLDDLMRVFPEFSIFDRIVAENGAVLFNPAKSELRTLTDPPPEDLASALEASGVRPLYQGRIVLATVVPNDVLARNVVARLALQFQVILNKGSVMILPAGVDKASGLRAALQELQIAPERVVGIGDAENDQALLEMSGCGVAVANALDGLKAAADIVTSGSRGAGVTELVDTLLSDDP